MRCGLVKNIFWAMSEELKNKDSQYYTSKTRYSLKWNSILSASSFIVSFIVGIALARILDPKDFGLLAMVSVFVSFVNLFVNAGTGSGLIQKKEINQADLSTVFWYNVTIGLLSALILIVLSNPIASFYNDNRLSDIVKVLALQPVISSLGIVQMNLMMRTIDLKKRTIAQLSGQLISATVGVPLALYGFGVWALVYSSLTSAFFSTFFYWIQSDWRPLFVFSYSSYKEIWNYSSKILYGNIVTQILNKIDILLIGRYLSPSIVGFYQKGRNLGQLPANQLGNIITKSYFPLLSRLQNDKIAFWNYFDSQSKTIAYLATIIFFLLSLVSTELIGILYGEKWLPSSIYLKITAFLGFFYTVNAFKVYALNALGRPDISLRRTVYLGVLKLILFFIPILMYGIVSPVYILYSILAVGIISYVWLSFDLAFLLETKMFNQVIKELRYFLVALPIYTLVDIVNLGSTNYCILILFKSTFLLLLFTFVMIITKESLTLSLINRTRSKFNKLYLNQ